MSAPVRYRRLKKKGHHITFDLWAIRRAMEVGTLTERDRETIEKVGLVPIFETTG